MVSVVILSFIVHEKKKVQEIGKKVESPTKGSNKIFSWPGIKNLIPGLHTVIEFSESMADG